MTHVIGKGRYGRETYPGRDGGGGGGGGASVLFWGVDEGSDSEPFALIPFGGVEAAFEAPGGANMVLPMPGVIDRLTAFQNAPDANEGVSITYELYLNNVATGVFVTLPTNQAAAVQNLIGSVLVNGSTDRIELRGTVTGSFGEGDGPEGIVVTARFRAA